MATILDLNGNKYHRFIGYLERISIRGWVTANGHLVYQIAPSVGRGIIITDPDRQTAELTDSVDKATAEYLSHAIKPQRRMVV